MSHILFSEPPRGKGTDMPTVGYARVSSTGQDLAVQLEKLAGCDKIFKEKRSSMIGRPRRIGCSGPAGAFLCLEFSTVDVPGLGPDLRPVFVQGDPAARPRRDRRRRSYHYLVESIRKFAGRTRLPMIRSRLFPRQLADPLGRHRGIAFGLAFVISALTHIARLARAGFVFAREGVFGVVDPLIGAAARATCAADWRVSSSGPAPNAVHGCRAR